MFLCWQEVVPSYLATSPIMSAGEELMETQLGRGSSRHHGRPDWKRCFWNLWKCELVFKVFFMLLSFSSLRHHSLQLTSCPEPGTAAKWRRDDQKEEEKKEEGPSRSKRGRRKKRGERGRVLRRRGHVYNWLELGWGERGWWQQVCVCTL